ncbi:MAG: hypothetical protein AB1491_11625 [Thermodesulfobacteriota bacterium]
MKKLKPAIGWASLALGLLLLLGPGVTAALANGESKAPAKPRQLKDYDLFLGELHSAGALKFYETTEEILRLGQFERALLRYRFLKGAVSGQSMYAPMVASINQRLRFLQEQMHLTAADIAPARRPKKRRVRRKVAQKPPPPVEAKPPATPEPGKPEGAPPAAAPPGQVIPGAPGVTPAKPPEAPPTAPPTVEEPKAAPGAEETPQAKEEKEAKPKPRPSLWQRIKKRLYFWKKKEKKPEKESEKSE